MGTGVLYPTVLLSLSILLAASPSVEQTQGEHIIFQSIKQRILCRGLCCSMFAFPPLICPDDVRLLDL